MAIGLHRCNCLSWMNLQTSVHRESTIVPGKKKTSINTFVEINLQLTWTHINITRCRCIINVDQGNMLDTTNRALVCSGKVVC